MQRKAGDQDADQGRDDNLYNELFLMAFGNIFASLLHLQILQSYTHDHVERLAIDAFIWHGVQAQKHRHCSFVYHIALNIV